MVGLALLGEGKWDSWIFAIVQGFSNLALQSFAQTLINSPTYNFEDIDYLGQMSLIRVWTKLCKLVGDLRNLAIVECNVLVRCLFIYFFPTLFMVAHQQYIFWTSPLSDPSVLGLRVLKDNVISLRKVWICMLSVCLSNTAQVYCFNQNSMKILKDLLWWTLSQIQWFIVFGRANCSRTDINRCTLTPRSCLKQMEPVASRKPLPLLCALYISQCHLRLTVCKQ